MTNPLPPDKAHLTEDEREKVSAYLDQELDEADTQQIATELSRRAEVRQEADSLRKTWELLDYLPRPSAPSTFTEKTLTMLESTKGVLLRQGVKWRRYAIAGWAACLVVAAVGGFLLTYSPNRPEEAGVEVNDVVPVDPLSAEPVPVSLEKNATPIKLKRDREKTLRPWQQDALQRNEKLRRELQLIVMELNRKMKREDRQRLNAASKEGGINYIILVIDLARQYQVPIPDLVPLATVPPPDHHPPGKKSFGSKGGLE